MTFITVANFSHLSAHLNLLDLELARIHSLIKNSRDPDSDGLFDRGEYFVGHGFIAIQGYITTLCAQTEINRFDSLKIPPLVTDDLSLVAAINAGANYCKHSEEWGLQKVVERNTNELSGPALRTIRAIEKLTPWDNYTCANLLSVLSGDKKIQLSPLLPRIMEWQNNLMKIFG